MRVQYSTKHIISVAIVFLLLFTLVPSQVAYASTAETRYMRSDSSIVNGATFYKLLTTQTGTAKTQSKNLVALSLTYLYPTSDVTAGWSRSEGSTNYGCVDEATYNDTDYVSAAPTGQVDRYGHTTFSLAAGDKIGGVRVSCRYKGAQIYFGLVIGGTFYSTLGPSKSSYGSAIIEWDLNPDTGTAWTQTDVNNAIIRLDNTKLSGTNYVSQVNILVFTYTDVTCYWGFQVWKRDSAGTETELTAGTQTFLTKTVSAYHSEGAQLRSTTWACPETALVSTDSIVVGVYYKVGAGGWILHSASSTGRFSTEQLGASQLDSATWTLYFYLECYLLPITYMQSLFRCDTATYNTRIENFTWTAAPSGAWHDVSTWTASLVTKTWSSGTSFSLNLLTRTWSTGTSWTENLQTRIWVWSSIQTDLIDSYNESHFNDVAPLRELHPSSSVENASAEGQSFTMLSSDHLITSCKFYLRKLVGSPTGMAHAVLYAHSGTYGIDSLPTGEPLATSEGFDVSTLTSSFQLITFTFNSSQQYQMQANTYYCIDYENPMSGNIDGNNYLLMGFEYGSPTHSGSNFLYYNYSFYTAPTSFDTIFYVYGTTLGTPSLSFNLLTRQYLTVASWLFDFGTKIWVDIAKTWTFDWITMAWENISWIFYLGTSIWTDIATWVSYPITRLFIDIVVWTFNETAMMWRDLTWLFTLLPSLPEWVNVAVWIFSLRSPEWLLVALWNLQLEAAGVIAFLFIAILLLIVIVAGIIVIAYRRPKQ